MENEFKNSEIKILKYIGGYNLNGSKDKSVGIFMCREIKPIFIHRFFSKLLLGWEWIDNK